MGPGDSCPSTATPGSAGSPIVGRQSEKSTLERLCDGVLPPGHPELSIYGPQVRLDSVDRYLQPAGNVLSGQRQITENLLLPRGEFHPGWRTRFGRSGLEVRCPRWRRAACRRPGGKTG